MYCFAPHTLLQLYHINRKFWYFWIKYDLGQKYYVPKFDPTEVRTHDLQIMTVHFMSLRHLMHAGKQLCFEKKSLVFSLWCTFIYWCMRQQSHFVVLFIYKKIW